VGEKIKKPLKEKNKTYNRAYFSAFEKVKTDPILRWTEEETADFGKLQNQNVCCFLLTMGWTGSTDFSFEVS
jgi:hypothetical protein